jgi:hypothetical protein
MRSFVAVALALLAGAALAAQQLVPTKTLVVKNQPSGTRKVLWNVKETGSAATVTGDPTIDGASLRIVLTPGGDQCVEMPASGWTAIGTIGFRYKDTGLLNGPVKIARIKKTPTGTFQIKALLRNGGATSIQVTPGAPTTSYGLNFQIGLAGDEYCGGTATATPTPNDDRTFKVANDGAPAGCIDSCNAMGARECCESITVDACAWLPPNICVINHGTVGAPGSECDSATGKCLNATPMPGACCDPAAPSHSSCRAGPEYAVNGCDSVTPAIPDSICPSSGGNCVPVTTTTTTSSTTTTDTVPVPTTTSTSTTTTASGTVTTTSTTVTSTTLP